jgi:hypothetical protein
VNGDTYAPIPARCLRLRPTAWRSTRKGYGEACYLLIRKGYGEGLLKVGDKVPGVLKAE